MKRIVVTLFSLIMILFVFSVNPLSSNASSLEPHNSGIINLDDLEVMEEEGKVVVEELTYDEFIQEMANENGVSIEKARNVYKNPNTNISKGAQSLSSGTYFMNKISIVQEVKFYYKPAIVIYAWTYNYGSFREMKYIEQVYLDRDGVNDIYTAKKFDGTVKGKLTSSTSVWWFIEGDFYDQGNMSISGGIGGSMSTIGREVSWSATMTRQTDWVEYWDKAGTHYIY